MKYSPLQLKLIILIILINEVYSKEIILPICGNFTEIFMYYVNLKFGTPNNDFTVVIDTGR